MSRFGGWAFNQHALHVKSSSFGEEQNKKKKEGKNRKCCSFTQHKNFCLLLFFSVSSDILFTHHIIVNAEKYAGCIN
jgi:hypothetical protein